ncbi:rCG45776 [Rattus norvegicus]|uniref:RCG45776 n=1 Tax=Rattus norvegicus TaxID=10116 RepID=A6JUB1_RAT|nr:rCG45776 [Rattus norvegicus]
MCVGMAGGQSVQGKRKEYDGWPGPSPSCNKSPSKWDPGQGSSPVTIGHCPCQGPHVEGSFLLPCSQATCEPPCVRCECVCTYVSVLPLPHSGQPWAAASPWS